MVELDNVGDPARTPGDARNRTAQEIADRVDVSANTVRNRIEQLEDDGIIEGYHPKIDYEAADLPLQVPFVCAAPPTDRAEIHQPVSEENPGDVDDTESPATGWPVDESVVSATSRSNATSE